MKNMIVGTVLCSIVGAALAKQITPKTSPELKQRLEALHDTAIRVETTLDTRCKDIPPFSDYSVPACKQAREFLAHIMHSLQEIDEDTPFNEDEVRGVHVASAKLEALESAVKHDTQEHSAKHACVADQRKRLGTQFKKK